MYVIGGWLTIKSLLKGPSSNTYSVGTICQLNKIAEKQKPAITQVNKFFRDKGFPIKQDVPEINDIEIDGFNGKIDFMTTNTKGFWAPIGMKMESCSANLHASARALAKVGAFMANKGTFKGKTLMSEETW